MRDYMMYDFNVSLKLLFFLSSFDEFKKYCFNCCRQTAIFGAAILTEKYPDYEYHIIESSFDDLFMNHPVHYEHAYIVASHKTINRHLLIDLARTQSPLLFEPISNMFQYSLTGEYKNATLLSSKELNLKEMFNTNETEYLTGIETKNVLKILHKMMNDFKNLDYIGRQFLANQMYNLPETLNIRG